MRDRETAPAGTPPRTPRRRTKRCRRWRAPSSPRRDRGGVHDEVQGKLQRAQPVRQLTGRKQGGIEMVRVLAGEPALHEVETREQGECAENHRGQEWRADTRNPLTSNCKSRKLQKRLGRLWSSRSAGAKCSPRLLPSKNPNPVVCASSPSTVRGQKHDRASLRARRGCSIRALDIRLSDFRIGA